MATFSRRGETFVCSIQCGAGRDALLEFELSPSPVGQPRVYTLPPLRHPGSGVDPILVLAAATRGAERATEFGTTWHIRSVGYVPNDSPHYDLLERCVWETIRHMAAGGSFPPSRPRR